MTFAALAGLLVSAALAGCLQGEVVSSAGGAGDTARAPLARVVVAVIDSGINPYHEAFRLNGSLPFSRAVPEAAGLPKLRLTFGENLEKSLEADRGVWAGVEPFALYEIEGTRLLAMSFLANNSDDPHGEVGPRLILDDNDYHGHGTPVTGRLLQANPDAYVVMVEAGPNGVGPALRWAARQPWIDVVSLSWGTAADLPYHLVNMRVAEASREAAKTKLVVFGSGNEPTVSTTDDAGGQPWNILAGGSGPHHGEDPLASRSPDFLAHSYVPGLPDADGVRSYHDHSGTSYSAPYVAGSLSKTILRLREALADPGPYPPGVAARDGAREITLWDVHEAFNRTATYWTPADWNPSSPPPPDPADPFGVTRPYLTGGTPILPHAGPAGPWVQMGWGAVVNETADLAARALLSGQLPEKPQEAVAYMQKRQELREAYWRQFCPQCFE